MYSFHAACGCFLPRWRWYTLDIEWLYWGSEKGLSSSVFSRFGGGWFSLSVEIPLPAGQWFHTYPEPLWSQPALKWARSYWRHGWVWHLDPGQDRPVDCGSPGPWKSEVQFLEMNSRVQVPSVGQICIDVSTESIWKEICTLRFESGLSKRNKTKWPLLEGDAVVVTLVSGGCPLERVKKFSYCMPSLGRV